MDSEMGEAIKMSKDMQDFKAALSASVKVVHMLKHMCMGGGIGKYAVCVRVCGCVREGEARIDPHVSRMLCLPASVHLSFDFSNTSCHSCLRQQLHTDLLRIKLESD